MADEDKKTAKGESPKVEVPKPTNPDKIKLLAPFGFIDDEGKTHWWDQGREVDVQEEIEMIISRGFKNFRVV